jgi:hypothetical protein
MATRTRLNVTVYVNCLPYVLKIVGSTAAVANHFNFQQAQLMGPVTMSPGQDIKN